MLFGLGLAVLVVGAEALIRGAVRIARRFGISPFLIGLTLVGFGTSAPELVVNLSAAYSGATDLAVGNVVGSNIANVGLILGVAALVRPLSAHMRLLKIEMPVLLGLSALVWVFASDGVISRIEGGMLLVGFFLFLGYMFRQARGETPAVREEIGSQTAAHAAAPWAAGLSVLVGLAGLVGGAELMVRSAVEMATALGVSQTLIGLTVLAIGTSLPELAATSAAAIRGQSDIAVGNVVGSNLFNFLLILGTTSAVRPLPVAESLIRVDIPVMVGFAILLVLVLANGLKVHRWEGSLLLAAYCGYIAWQVVQAA
ncbi:MAG TPA: calcium/sodium antiporter [Fimbriiglobus sp.]